MFRLPLLPVLAVCAVAVAFSSTAAAQTKVGVINLEKAMLDTAEMKKAMVDLPLKYKPKQDQLEKIQREMQDLQSQLQSGKLSPAASADAEARGQQLQRQADRLNQDLQEEVTADRNDILMRAQTRMYEVVKKLADEKGIDVVVTSAAAFYFKTAVEITADATVAYDKAYPLK
ncbi:MAG: OmpH family outer membrane protein [Bryobacterales bacterium]|nr:OmpH family outer membrane protein [Bryobacterales bacterium]MBV9401228.1 OmpH family outer membrane protein [Bryobacterales bacterium]